MNFFEQELRRLFSGQPEFAEAKYIGRVCITPIDEEVKIRAEFVTCGTMGQYEALKLTALNRTDGAMDQLVLRFSDCFTSKVNVCGNITAPYIWTYNEKAEWYGSPSPTDLQSLTDAARDYVGVFEPREQMEQTIEM